MERWVCTRRTVHGDPEAIRRRLITEIRPLLQRAAGGPLAEPGGDGAFELVLRSGRMARTVEARVGEVLDQRHWVQIPLRWRSRGPAGPLFPTFEGWVELEDADRVTVTVAVLGHYQPPASLVGLAVDAIALSSIAEATIEELAVGVANQLEGHGTTVEPVPARTGLDVGDVMTPEPITLREDASLRTAADLLLTRRIGGVPVVNDRGRLVGVLSEKDLLDKVAPVRYGLGGQVERSWRHRDAETVGQACTRPARTTMVESSLREAAGEMARHGVGRLVVMRGAEVAGMLTRSDVMKALIREDEAIEQGVRAVVADLSEPHVTTEVADGIVVLTGSVERRSSLGGLLERIEAVDGVIAVRSDRLTWDVDDVTIAYPMV
ncbi:HPP family protein [Euzebya sp.]|uniref:CBS domain-containing protein n=1 Tax=Euzebya sp. TaxID=1971409 RepID=UPI003511689F